MTQPPNRDLVELLRSKAEWLRRMYVSSDMQQAITEAADEIERLRAAIRKHRDYRGDDRCHLDDGELYAVLPEGDTRPAQDTAVTLENCQRYIECRQQGREYVSPEREIERLRETVATRERMLAEASSAIVRLREQVAGHCDRIAAQSDLLTRRAEKQEDSH